MNEVFIKRLKSLLWRSAMMALAFLFSFLAENVVSLELGTEITALLGLALGEVSKYLNTQSANVFPTAVGKISTKKVAKKKKK